MNAPMWARRVSDMRRTPVSALMAAGFLAAGSFGADAVFAQETSRLDAKVALNTPIALSVGHSMVLDFPEPIDRASINNTSVADVVVVSPQQLLVHGKEPGSTSLIIWRTGSNEFFLVNVALDVQALEKEIKQVLVDEGVEVRSSAGVLTLTGEVSSQAAADRAVSIAKIFMASKAISAVAAEVEEKKVINLLRVKRRPLNEILVEFFPDEQIAARETPDGVVLTGEVGSQTTMDHAATLAQSYSAKVTNFLAVRKPSFDGLLKQLVPGEDLTVHQQGDTIILSGTAKNPLSSVKAEQAAAVSAEHVVNLIDVPDRKQVMLEVRFAEVKRSISDAFGIDYMVQNTQFTQGHFLSGALSPQLPSTPQYSRISDTDVALSEVVTDYFELRQNADIGVALNMLQEKGLIRILAEPNLVAMSGEEASFLAGGEFPIPIVQGTGGITIEFKEFGIRLNFKPEVQINDAIRLHVEPEVSLLDFATAAVELGGFRIPGLITRKASTNVQLMSGESLAIGGLLTQMDTNSNNSIPYLGKIPIIGQLFNSHDFQNEETELIVLVTPHVILPTDLNMPKPYADMETVGKTMKDHVSPPPFEDERGDAIRYAIKKAEDDQKQEEARMKEETRKQEETARKQEEAAQAAAKEAAAAPTPSAPQGEMRGVAEPVPADGQAQATAESSAQPDQIEGVKEDTGEEAFVPPAGSSTRSFGFSTDAFRADGGAAEPGRAQGASGQEAEGESSASSEPSVSRETEMPVVSPDIHEQTEPVDEMESEGARWHRLPSDDCDERGWIHHNAFFSGITGRFTNNEPCDEESGDEKGFGGKKNFYTKPDDDQWHHHDKNGPLDGNLS